MYLAKKLWITILFIYNVRKKICFDFDSLAMEADMKHDLTYGWTMACTLALIDRYSFHRLTVTEGLPVPHSQNNKCDCRDSKSSSIDIRPFRPASLLSPRRPCSCCLQIDTSCFSSCSFPCFASCSFIIAQRKHQLFKQLINILCLDWNYIRIYIGK